MRENIKERVIEAAAYIIEHKATVRATAAVFDVSKSTIHTDMTVRLPKIDGDSYKKVKKILGINLEERHVRGGESTKRKYRGE